MNMSKVTTIMKVKTLAILSLVVILFVAIFLMITDNPKIARAIDTPDKIDLVCTGQETAGRCADKCPDDSYEIGRETNGSAICHLQPTGCPYGDSIPLGLDCDKAAPPAEVLEPMEGK